MRWIKYTLIGLAGILLVCCALIATVVYLFDDSHYRNALVAVVEHQTGDRLKIEGPFKLDLSLYPRLVASEITLESDTDEYDVEIGKFLVEIELLPLVSHRLVIRELAVDDLTLNIRAHYDDGGTPWNLNLDKIAVPVIENTLFSNIKVNYWRPDDSSPVNFVLSELGIDDINDAGPVMMRGSGDLEGTGFTFKGEFGELARLLQTDQPYPVSINLTMPNGHYTLDGIVGNPDEGSELDLQFQGKIPELHNALKLLHIDTPVLGLLEFHGRIRGELAQPALDDLQIDLSHDDVLEFTAKGSVGNLFTKEGTDIRFEATSTDADFIKWFTVEMSDGNHFVCSGKLEALDGIFWLRNFESEASNPPGLKLGISGESGLVLTSQPFRHLNAVFTFSAPDSAAARPLLFEQLPELGAIKGRGTYTSPADSDALAMKDIHIQFGPRNGLSVLATGSIGRVPLGDDPISEIAINIDIKSPTTKQVADALDMTLPELGTTRVRGLYAGSADSSAFRNMSVIAGSPNTVLLEARGELDFGSLDTDEAIKMVKLALNASAPSTSRLSPVIGHDFPDFGTLEARGNLTGSVSNLNLANINLTTRRKDDLLVNIRGDIRHLTRDRQWNLNAEVSARDLKALGDPFNQPLPSAGAVKAFGKLKGSQEKIQFQGEVDLSKTSITTRITGAYGAKRPKFQGTITIPELDVGDFGIHPPGAKKTGSHNSAQPVKSKPEESNTFFRKDRFHLDMLNVLDLDFDITIDEVTGTQVLIDTIQAKLVLSDGTLNISPVDLVFDDGKMKLDANLFGNTKPPRMTLAVKGDDLKIGTMLGQLQDHPVAHGFLTVVVDLETQGNSPADAAPTLNGVASFAAENEKVRKTELELLTTDFFGWAVSSALAHERYVNVDCAILRTKTVNGIMSIESLMMDTPSIHVKGGGTINLVNQTIDMAVYPKKKTKLWRTTNPIKIHGPLADPEVDAVSARAIAQNYGPLIVAPMLFLPAEALGHLVGLINERGEKDSPCLKYTKAKNKKAKVSN